MARRYRERVALPFRKGTDFSPASIRAACLEIQRTWSPAERLRRSGAGDMHESLRDALARVQTPLVYSFGTTSVRVRSR